MAKQIQYGMVGGGIHAFIGDVHRKGIQFDPRATFVCGCFSQDPQKNAATGEAYHLSKDRVYDDYRQMAQAEAAREDRIDFVSITTPNAVHYEIAKEFLKAGIHVVCDKPLCFTVAEAEELVALAAEKNLLFAVTYAYSGYTMVKVAKEMIASGKIGEIAAVNAEYAQDWLLDELSAEKDSNAKNLSVWRMDPAHAGISNCVGDIGTHVEHTVHYMTGLTVKRVAATVNRFGHALDLNANMLVEYTNGVNGAYWCSQIAAGRLNGLSVRVYGTKGSLEWDQHSPDYLQYTPKDEPTQTLARGCGYLKEEAAAVSRIPCGHPEGYHIGFANIYRNMISTLIKKKAGESPSAADLDFPTAQDGLAGVRFVHAVISSADHDSKWVTI